MQQDFFKGTTAERISVMIKSPLFLWGNIAVSLFSVFLLLDFPVIILSLIGLWRLFAARKDEFATEKIKKAIQMLRTSMAVNFIAMAVQIFFWGLGDMPQRDEVSVMPYALPYFKSYWPILFLFATGFLASYRCGVQLREPYGKSRLLQMLTGIILLLFIGYLGYTATWLLPLQNAIGATVIGAFGGLVALSCLLYGVWLIRYSKTEI